MADHMRQRAFVAEVLLYDRLVIPYPPAEENTAVWGWNLDALDRKLKILGDDIALRVPWNEWARERFKTRYRSMAKYVTEDGIHVVNEQGSRPDEFHMTRMVLAQDCLPKLPQGVSKVWALAAYPSVNAYDEDEKQASADERKQTLAMVLTNRFLVPENPRKSDDDLLREAVALARRDDIREKRAKFHRWQEDIIDQGISDARAVEELEEHLKKYTTAVERATSEVYWKYAFMALPTLLSMATGDPGAPMIVAGATGLVSLASFARFDRQPKIDQGDFEAAALIHDVQDHLKWK